MAMRINANIRNVRRRLRRAQSHLNDFRSLHRRASQTMRDWVMRNFDTEGGNVGGWRRLSSVTVNERIAKGFGAGPILQRSGRLKNSLRTMSDTRQATLRYGAPYAGVHHFGSRRARIPSRPLFPTERQAERVLQPVLGRHVSVAIRRI